MKKLLALLSLITGVTSFTQIANPQNSLISNKEVKDDISLVNLNKKGHFSFFNNDFGLVINQTELNFLDKDQKFIKIPNPGELNFNEFIDGRGGTYGILKDSNSGFLYLLTEDGKINLLKANYLNIEYNLTGKVTAISNTAFIVETKINEKNVIFLGQIKNETLQSLTNILELSEPTNEVTYIRDNEVILKTSSSDYSLLVNKSNYTINKLASQGKYFFKTNIEAWVIKDNNQLAIFNFTKNTYKELPLFGEDIIGLNSNLYILKHDTKTITLIDKTGKIIKDNYNFEISNNYSLLNINSKLVLLFDNQNNKEGKIIQRELYGKTELTVLETINFNSEINQIKSLNTQQKAVDSSSDFLIEPVNNFNYVMNINSNIKNLEKLEVNFKTIPNYMNGDITKINKTASIFTETETNELFWYQAF